MENCTLIAEAKILTRGRITIPKCVRTSLDLHTGDCVAFLVDGFKVRIVNADPRPEQFDEMLHEW